MKAIFEPSGDHAGSPSNAGSVVSWRSEPPSAEALAAAVSGVLAERERFASGARRRAVERFALADWLDRHAAIFAELVPQDERAPR